MKTKTLTTTRPSPLTRIQGALLTLICALIILSASAPRAAAQSPGFPDILGDIFGGKTEQGNPYGQAPAGLVYIENIPVQVSFDSRPDILPPEATLIVTAIAPPPPNVRRARPLIMGETRLLISRLASPLQMVIAVPSDMARDADYAQIEARIVDANGVETHRLRDSVQYSGGQPPFLDLISVNAPVYERNQNQIPVQGQRPLHPNSPYNPPSFTQIEGLISLPAGSEPKRGATLIVQLRENGLAGGAIGNVVEEKRIDIDQVSPPYDFRMPVPQRSNGALESPDMTVWIEDWAGRKTHIMARPVPVSLNDTRNKPVQLRIQLDAMTTGQHAVDSTRIYTPPPGVNRTLTGRVEFDAYKGLPAGSTLTVRLRNADRLDETIAKQNISLDGLSGHIDYSMPVELIDIQGRPSDPLLDAVITDKTGKLMFTTRLLKPLPKTDTGPINIAMQPAPDY